ncbi:peptidoglycan DD-metalloendopeptidase family protein [Bacteroidia bacterium]|nr:peptidoglycan DD-metalloendopeptidase family protein [Bacteroidia bacterium]
MLVLHMPLDAQTSRKALEAKRKRVQRELAQSQRILKSTTNKKKATLHQLSTLKRVIKQRKELIISLEKEIIATEEEIVRQHEQLILLQKELNKVKAQLNETVKKAYKSRKTGRELAFVFSSKNIKQALRRWKYLRKVSDYRRFQIAELKDQQTKVQNAINALNRIRKEKSALLLSQERERKKLENDEKSKSRLVKTLSKKESSLNSQIKQKQRQMAKLNAAIKAAIKREIEAERRRREREAARRARAKKEGKSTSNRTPEAVKLSSAFERNKGGLPWPVKRGFVSQTFGVHKHPEFRNITLQNNGVDITTNKGESVYSVFNGSVSAILSIPGQGDAVLVNHGDFFTVYSRMKSIQVRKGQKIKTGQKLGSVMTDEEDKSILQFQVWQGQEKQDPQKWLKGR